MNRWLELGPAEATPNQLHSFAIAPLVRNRPRQRVRKDSRLRCGPKENQIIIGTQEKFNVISSSSSEGLDRWKRGVKVRICTLFDLDIWKIRNDFFQRFPRFGRIRRFWQKRPRRHVRRGISNSGGGHPVLSGGNARQSTALIELASTNYYCFGWIGCCFAVLPPSRGRKFISGQGGQRHRCAYSTNPSSSGEILGTEA